MTSITSNTPMSTENVFKSGEIGNVKKVGIMSKLLSAKPDNAITGRPPGATLGSSRALHANAHLINDRVLLDIRGLKGDTKAELMDQVRQVAENKDQLVKDFKLSAASKNAVDHEAANAVNNTPESLGAQALAAALPPELSDHVASFMPEPTQAVNYGHQANSADLTPKERSAVAEAANEMLADEDVNGWQDSQDSSRVRLPEDLKAKDFNHTQELEAKNEQATNVAYQNSVEGVFGAMLEHAANANNPDS